jgi:hypothetical protein
MKNKQANLSRRSVLGGFLAALAASPALAMAAAPENGDSALLAIGHEWQEAWKNLQGIYRKAEEADERYKAMCPDFPAACIRQEGDPALGLCIPNRIGEPYEANIIEQRRGKAWPQLEAQARADEIVAAWDKYRAALHVIQEQSGFAQANRDECEAVEALHEIEGRIVRTRAKTPKGMLVKARMAALDPTKVDGRRYGTRP